MIPKISYKSPILAKVCKFGHRHKLAVLKLVFHTFLCHSGLYNRTGKKPFPMRAWYALCMGLCIEKKVTNMWPVIYADNLFLPFARLAAKTFLPPGVLILALKPWTLLLCLFFGWYVIFILKTPPSQLPVHRDMLVQTHRLTVSYQFQ